MTTPSHLHTQRYPSIYSALIIINRALLGIIVLLLGLLFLSIHHNDKAPIMLRYTQDSIQRVEVDENGEQIIVDDAMIFAEHFIHLMNVHDSFTLEDKLPRALAMMDQPLQHHINTTLLTNDFLKTVLASNIKTRTTIKEVSLERFDSKFVGNVVYERYLSSLDSNAEMKLLIKTELVIENLGKRTKDYPYGLKILKYKEYRMN